MSGCYICRPDDPMASEEGCEACEASWWNYYAAAYVGIGTSPTSQRTEPG